ncbi:hypothetical protein KJ596_03735 [Patescibacteria group bacterium]|nr:hypothetical protein [Patescibacteria group bacterium]MBU1868277.1 hypothetical protein [Patescibacteria group bacterium]
MAPPESHEDFIQRRVEGREASQHRRRFDRENLIVRITVAFVFILTVLYALDFLGLVDLPLPFLKQPQKKTQEQTPGQEWLLDLPTSQEQIEAEITPLGFTIEEADPVEGRKNFIGTKGTSYVQFFKRDGKVELSLINVQVTDDNSANDEKKVAVKTFARTMDSDSENWAIEGFEYVIKNREENYFSQETFNGQLAVIRYENTQYYDTFLLAYMLGGNVYDDEPFEIRGEILVSF